MTKNSLLKRQETANNNFDLYSRPGFLIRRLHQIHLHLFNEETREYAISPVQYSLLTVLDEHGEMDQNTLALKLGLERTSVAEVIPRLVARGLLSRRQNDLDKRFKLVDLTVEGKHLLCEMREAVERAHDMTINALPVEEQQQLLGFLSKLVEANNDRINVPMKLK